MLVIRPVDDHDLDALLSLSGRAGFGLTTLPQDRQVLARRIRESKRGFAKAEDEVPSGETFLFVLEDLHKGVIVGTCGVASKVGGFEPFYGYKLETETLVSTVLDVRKEVTTLHLVTEHDGPCEIGSLFLHPDYRQGGNGRLLSLCRFLFMAEYPQFFDETVIAEMRGVLDETGRSPFWEALGRHFFEIDYPKADHLSISNKRFIAELMPRHPIYVTLLPPDAQAVIGQVHEQTRPALRILEAEGFRFDAMVDIFEAGPMVRCPLQDIRAVRESQVASVVRITESQPEGEAMLLATRRRLMRVVRAPVLADLGGVAIGSATALALGVKEGDSIRYVALKPEPANPSAAAVA